VVQVTPTDNLSQIVRDDHSAAAVVPVDHLQGALAAAWTLFLELERRQINISGLSYRDGQ
jgi:hypothetical protein